MLKKLRTREENNLPLYLQLRDQLRDAILKGQFKLHERLPSEHKLVALHGVSRITVRSALNDLQHSGFIIRQQGKGAFVAPQRSAVNLQRLQGFAEALSASGQSVQSQRISMRIVKADLHVRSLLALGVNDKVYKLLTLRYVDRRAASVNCSYFPVLLGARIERLDLSERDLIDVMEQDLGIAVSQAQLEISAVLLPAREAKWLNAEPGAAALRVRRILQNEEMQPLQIETTLHRAEGFTYQLNLKR